LQVLVVEFKSDLMLSAFCLKMKSTYLPIHHIYNLHTFNTVLRKQYLNIQIDLHSEDDLELQSNVILRPRKHRAPCFNSFRSYLESICSIILIKGLSFLPNMLQILSYPGHAKLGKGLKSVKSFGSLSISL